MNSITFSVGYLMAILMVCDSSKDYVMSDKDKVTKNGPYNFSFLNWNDFLLMEITLKNIPPSVTDVYIIYILTGYFATEDTKAVKEKVDAEIKNGEVKILFLRSLSNYRIVVDVELQTREGLCNKARVAEGRFADTDRKYYKYNNTLRDFVYWDTNWKYDVSDTGACVVPKLCEIVVDFQSQCEENLKCYLDGKNNICTFYTGKMNPYKLYQTYDTDKQRTKPFFRKDYTYIDAVDSFYKIHTTAKNWSDALKSCAKEGASLFYPENGDEAEAVISFWKKNGTSLQFMYVGISDTLNEGAFVTIDGKPVSEVYSKWNYNQPDDYNNEDCLHMNLKGKYNDIPCYNKYNFICKKSLQHNFSSVIGDRLDISASYTRFIFELEPFDKNTSVNIETLEHGRYNPLSEKIILPTEEPVKNIFKKVMYTETTEVQFSCEDLKLRSKYLYLAFINKTVNKIQTLNKKLTYNRKFKKADSGSILCCLYYVNDSKPDGKEVKITRFVVKKTLLTYQDKESMPANAAKVKEQSTSASKDNDYNWLIYLSAAVLGVSVLILAIYIISKKHCVKNSQPVDETVEFDNQGTQDHQDQVLYANLDFQTNANRPLNQNEESHYANIVGILHPH